MTTPQFKTFWSKLTAKQKSDLAEGIGSSRDHVAHVANGHKNASVQWWRVLEIEVTKLKAELKTKKNL